MRGLFTLILICLIFFSYPANACLITKKDFNIALIYHYTNISDRINAGKICDKLAKSEIDKDLITTCLAASEKRGDNECILSQLNSKKDNKDKNFQTKKTAMPLQYKSKLPTEFKLEEKLFYEALNSKDYKTALTHLHEMLKEQPNNTKLLKHRVDIAVAQEDYSNAIKYYEKLIKLSHKQKYKLELANLYMVNQDFSKAQEILEPIYYKNLGETKVTYAYLNSLLAQQKTYEAYELIRKNNMLNTKEGYVVLGDLAILNKKYDEAAKNYFRASQLDPKDVVLENKLAYSYRMMGYINGAEKLYCDALSKDSKNLETRLGLGSIEIDKKNYTKAREMLCCLLDENPDYRPAKIAVAYSYIANNEKLSALEILDKLSDDNESKMMKAQVYYDFNMKTDSKEILKRTTGKDAEALRFNIKKDNAITITPVYSFFFSQLDDEYNLDYQRYGIKVSQNGAGNSNVFMEYNAYWYSSGEPYYLNNVTNEFRGGIQARPNRKWEYKADIGVKSFEFGNGAMLVTDSWIKHYFNDKFNLKAGIRRNNLEQSYLSAVGEYMDGIFTGRVADTKLYIDYEGKLPYEFYTYGRGSSGFMYAQNLPTNPYFELMFGVGKTVYNNPRNKWIQTFATDIVTYNSSYRYNLLNLYDSKGVLFGGYFSPDYFNATTLNLRLEGEHKKWHIKYGIAGFGGIQTAMTPDQGNPTWGFSPYLSYEINNHIELNSSYTHLIYADVERDIFMVNLVMRGFKKNGKN